MKVGMLMGLESFLSCVECLVCMVLIWGCVSGFEEIVVNIDVVLDVGVWDFVVYMVVNVCVVLVFYGLVVVVFEFEKF